MHETREMQIRSLSQEDLLKKDIATHSSIFACKIPWTAEPSVVHEVAKSQTPLSDHVHSSFSAASLQPATQWLRAARTGISLHSPVIKAPASKFLWSLPFPRMSFIRSLLALIPGVGKIP